MQVGAPLADPKMLARRRSARLAVAAGASVVITSTLGRLVTSHSLTSWYRTLRKPPFNPPNWAFPVAWTLLFVLMGVAFWRVLRTPRHTRGRSLGIALFLTQLLFNVGWSAAFFGSRSAARGMLVIVPFWLLIIATALAFRRVDRPAAWLFTPYIAWVSFAIALNLAIWQLN